MRAFVRRETRLRSVADVPGLQFNLADDVTLLWHRAGEFLGDPDPPLPYWAFTWSGGLAIARYLLARPEEVAGKRVLDMGTGSGLCAIVAAQLGAESVEAIDIDPLAEAAVAGNTRTANVRVRFSGSDILDESPPPVDVVLAGDVSYEEAMATRMIAWLRPAALAGSRVLIGDPGRGYLAHGLESVATYEVNTSREIETREVTASTVWTLPAA
jgi:predicted nicotinamide N-methyase